MYYDDILDDSVIAYSRALLIDLNGDRSSAQYKNVFRITPTESVAGMANETQDLEIDKIIQNSSGESYSGYSKYLDAIKSALTDVKKYREDKAIAVKKESLAHNELNIAKSSAIKLYNRTYHLLFINFENESLIENFFMKW